MSLCLHDSIDDLILYSIYTGRVGWGCEMTFPSPGLVHRNPDVNCKKHLAMTPIQTLQILKIFKCALWVLVIATLSLKFHDNKFSVCLNF